MAGSAVVGLLARTVHRVRVAGKWQTQAVEVAASGWQRAAGLPVEVRRGTGGLAGVSVAVAGSRATKALGIRGVVLSLAARGGSGEAQVELSYAAFAGMYGAAWSSRLRLVELPSCAISDPARAACRRMVPVPSVNNYRSRTVSALVSLGSAGAGPAARLSSAVVRPDANGAMILAATSGPSGPAGDFTATPLRPSGTWAEQDGAFTYSYPLVLPPALAGSAPNVTFSYDSQSVDSETSGSNTQGGWIGDGWDYSPGFIERSYEPCSQDGITNAADLCFGGQNATLSLGAHSSQLVLDSSGGWHLKADDGTKVQLLQAPSSPGNGLWNNEYWVVTTTDGTQYYFGLDHLPGGSGSDPSTNAAWGEPVYNPHSGDPCYSSSSGQNSFCQMGWRWNLDFVVDPMKRVTVYRYAAETNYYDRGYVQGNGTGTLTQYTRGGYLTEIDYGYLLPDAIAGASPAAKVIFTSSDRCLSSQSTCDANHTATYWPDVPWDQNCGSSGSCTNYSPTFWTTQMLTGITTKVLESGTYKSVDSWTLAQAFPVGAGSNPVMELSSITRQGLDGGSLAVPAVQFTTSEIDNRVDGLVPSEPPVYRPRITGITTETGALITVTYQTPGCSRLQGIMPAHDYSNTMPCFPVWWAPPGGSLAEDWFTKSLVSQIAVSDQTGAGSPAQVTSYAYLGKAAWHYDDNPLVPSSKRTWDQFRGYQQIETTTGQAPDPVTETIQTYMQGMDGDNNGTGGTRSVTVQDPAGDPTVTDSDWLAGQVIEADTYSAASGAVVKRQVSGWSYNQTADQSQPGGLPDLTAHMIASSTSRTDLLFTGGTWRSGLTTTYYNSSALPVATDNAPYGSPETCATTSYATAPSGNSMMESYPDRVTTVTGANSGGKCPAASSADIVSDQETYYDDATSTLSSMGSLGSLAYPGGQPTGTKRAITWPGGGEVWQAQSATGYDALGRVTSLTAPTPNGATGNATTTTAYTPSYASGATGTELPTKIKVTNPLTWATTTTYDQGRESRLTVTDQNGEVTTAGYDALGRLTSVIMPRDQASGDKTITYAYTDTGTAPSTVTTSTLREDGSSSSDVKIYDGMLQLRQEQATPVNAAAGRIITDTFYDSHGWVVKARNGYYDATTSPGITMYMAGDGSIPGWTATTYDGMGRFTVKAFYSGNTEQWQTSTNYPGMNETDVTPAAGGTATSKFTNVLGQVTASWRYTTATPDGNSAHADVTSYTYNAAGQQATVTDNAGNNWSYTYDLAGETVSATDPGTKAPMSTTYDAAGNIASVTDARGQQLSYQYDLIGREIAEYSGTLTGTLLATWGYDQAPLNGGPAAALGYPSSSTSYDSAGGASGGPYTESVTGYSVGYQPTGTSTSIPAKDLVPGATGTDTFTTTSTYTPLTGLLSSEAFSADNGLPAETVHYSYNLQGELTSSGGATALLDQAVYDPLGNIQRTTYGLYGKQLVQTYTQDPATHWTTQVTTNLQTLASGAADTYSYTYNKAGILTSVSDAQNGGATQLQCFSYNNLGELTTAWTDTKGTSTVAAPSVTGIGGCVTTTPSASTIGGPAPYWQSYTDDLLGDRTSATFHDTSGNTANDITQTLTYPGNGTTAAAQPDAATTTTTQRGGSGGPSTTVTAAYDPAGNTVSRKVTATSGTNPPSGPPTESNITYNAGGLTAKVTTSSGTSGYTYDADGNLLLQSGPSGNILYLEGGAEQLTYNTSTAAVTAQRFYAGPDGTTIVRSYDNNAKATTITDETANIQGTSSESISTTTQAITRRYFDPFGNPIGAVPSSWPDNHAFLGKPTDPTTGLDLLGARNYDSSTGRFLTLDPVFEPGDPLAMGGYAYADNTPTTNTDPTGKMFVVPGGGGGGGGTYSPSVFETVHTYTEAALAPFDIVAADHWVSALERVAGQKERWGSELDDAIAQVKSGMEALPGESHAQELMNLAGTADRINNKLYAWDTFAPDWLRLAAGKLAVIKGTGYVLGGLGILGDVGTMISPPDKGDLGNVDRGVAFVNGGLIAANLALDEFPVVGEAMMIGTGVYLAGDYLYNHWTPFHNFCDSVGSSVVNSVTSIGHLGSSAWHSATNFLGDLF